jgi:hypothetical protein
MQERRNAIVHNQVLLLSFTESIDVKVQFVYMNDNTWKPWTGWHLKFTLDCYNIA